MPIPQEVKDYLEKRGKARRGHWGIGDLRPEPNDPVHTKPLFGETHADRISEFVRQLRGLVDGFTSPSEGKGYYVLEWRLKPYTKLTRAHMEYVAAAKDPADRKARLLECGVDTDAGGCGCGCGCGE